MVNLLKWIDPESTFGWTYIRIERGTLEAGPFTELTSADIVGYVNGTGLLLGTPHVTYAKDVTGSVNNWYRIRFYDGTNFSDYSDAMIAFDFRGYCTIDEVRSFTNVQATEYSDGQLQLIIDGVTADIDDFTGRTWQMIHTETEELYDGNGEDLLALDDGDIQTVTAITVDTDQDGVFETTVAVATDVYIYYVNGCIVLNKSRAPIKVWPNKRQSIKVTYTYGNADPTNDVRHLALMMVANILCIKPEMTALIDKKISELTRRSILTV